MFKNVSLLFCIIIIIFLSIMLYKKQNDVVECNQKQVIIVQETYDSFYKENLKQLSNIHREIRNINKEKNIKNDMIIKLTQWWQENER